jgi:D-alanyl-D-alanine carboxypeptidase
MLLDRIDAIAQRALDEAEAQGMAIGIAIPSGERIIRTYGFANRDAAIPVGNATLFEIGSISKSFLAIVFMQLAAEGKIDLHAPVTDYLPWFSVRSEHAPITAHHLLCHTAGLPTGFAHRPDGAFELWELRNVRAGAPGECWHYSDVGYSLLGVLAETVLGKSFDQLLTERVLEPLGFATATASVTSGMRPELAVGYKRQFDDRPWRSGGTVFPATWLETSSGAGSIVMDASDLLGYAEFLLRTWQGTDSPVLTSAQLRAMVDPGRLPGAAAEAEYGYALNWGSDDDSNEIVFIGHGGDMVGYEADLVVDIANGICVVMLANGAVPDYMMTNDLRKVVVASIAGVPLPELSTETRRSNYYLAVDHPAWERNLLEADREDSGDGDTPGPIVKLHHGGETFVRDREPLIEPPAYPAEWNGYVGFYRSYNPWYPAFRVVIREGTLVLIDSTGAASTLVPEDDGFRVGAQPPNFDWLSFHPIIEGQAHGIRFETGAEYNRFFAD